jgi:hypothetical protein
MTANITCYAPFQGLATSLDTLCAQAYGSGHKHLVGLQLQRMTYFLYSIMVPVAILWVFAEDVLLLIIPEARSAELAGLYLKVSPKTNRTCTFSPCPPNRGGTGRDRTHIPFPAPESRGLEWLKSESSRVDIFNRGRRRFWSGEHALGSVVMAVLESCTTQKQNNKLTYFYPLDHHRRYARLRRI